MGNLEVVESSPWLDDRLRRLHRCGSKHTLLGMHISLCSMSGKLSVRFLEESMEFKICLSVPRPYLAGGVVPVFVLLVVSPFLLLYVHVHTYLVTLAIACIFLLKCLYSCSNCAVAMEECLKAD